MVIYEAVEHGEGYPAKIHIVSIQVAPVHWHYDYELILILKGSLMVREQGKGSVLLKEGDIYLVNTCMVHDLKRTEEANLCLVIQIAQELFCEFGHTRNGRYYFHLNLSGEDKTPEIRSLAAEIGYCGTLGTVSSAYRIKGLLYLLISELFEYVTYELYVNVITTMDESEEKMFSEIMNYLQENYTNANAMDDVMKELGFSQKTFYRFLKKKLAMTPKDLLQEVRLEAAKNMLQNSEKKISYIADICGFGSETSFFRVFKNAYGVTPSAYRRYHSRNSHSPHLEFELSVTDEQIRNLLAEYMPDRS